MRILYLKMNRGKIRGIKLVQLNHGGYVIRVIVHEGSVHETGHFGSTSLFWELNTGMNTQNR